MTIVRSEMVIMTWNTRGMVEVVCPYRRMGGDHKGEKNLFPMGPGNSVVV